jgi:hypothetical protein
LQVEAELPDGFGLELSSFQLDDVVAAELDVVQEQVDEELVAAHVQQHLSPDEGKACTQFEQKFGDVFDQGMFHFALLCFVGQPQKVKAVRVSDGLQRKVRLGLGQAGFKISHGHAAALVQAGFDLHGQHVARPVMLDRFGGIPAPSLGAA